MPVLRHEVEEEVRGYEGDEFGSADLGRGIGGEGLDGEVQVIFGSAVCCGFVAVLRWTAGLGVDVFEAVVLDQVLSYRAPAGANACRLLVFVESEDERMSASEASTYSRKCQ